MTLYPAQIDTTANIPDVVDNATSVKGEVVNDVKGAVFAIEKELGVRPSSVYGTVSSRLDVIETILNSGSTGFVSFNGDLTGTAVNQSVVGIRGITISSATPLNGQFLGYNGTNWLPQSIPAGFTAGGDLTGTSSSQTVTKVKGTAITTAGGALTTGYVLMTTGTSSADWSALPSISAVQNGGNYGHYTIAPTFQPFSTSNATFTNAACFEFDPTTITAANGTRTIKLKAIVETTSPQITVQLYNMGASAVVVGSTLTSSSLTAVELSTADLTSNLTNGTAIYFVQILSATGSLTDKVTLDYAALKIEWS